jgi:chemotaxis protein CheZ
MNNIDKIISQFLEVLGSHLNTEQETLIFHQIENILAQINALKKDISNISSEILHDNFIPDVTMELRAVIQQTERSVTSILDIADEITALSYQISEKAIREELSVKVTRILELCNFQDLTGQRIQKIASHLNEIESVIYKMLHALSPEEKLRKKDTHKPDKHLLSGPQKEEDIPSQNEIDDLFNSL